MKMEAIIMSNNIPRPEYPRPQFVRSTWTNLNGEWEFYKDLSASGENRKLWLCEKFDETITVPFCPESKLSGIGYTDFMDAVWYAKNVNITEEQLSGRVILHFGACDYFTTVYVNGEKVGTHRGGYTSFTFDITDSLHVGENRIVVHALDDVRSRKQPAGKQSDKYQSYGCFYTRTTGIWQTVWLEYVPETYIEKVKITATDLGGAAALTVHLNKYVSEAMLKIEASFEGKAVASEEIHLSGIVSEGSFKVSDVHLWNVGEPNLYDIKYTLVIDGKEIDTATGYFGIRRIDIDVYKVRINGKSVFQRLILDQGYYPDGIYTAPSDDDLKRDIQLALDAGFNGARFHEKVFEERSLYHADKMGYLVWGEYPNWGVETSDPDTLHAYVREWIESVERDYNHPCIIGWCPYNECIAQNNSHTQIDTNVEAIFDATKAIDKTRPVIDTSGYVHTERTDIYDVHDYNQDIEYWEKAMKDHSDGKWMKVDTYAHQKYKYFGKTPFMVSEYGGARWAPDNGEKTPSWGYGETPKSVEDFCNRYCAITETILGASNIMGFCYTQLTDIEQEQNGLYYYGREKKFPDEIYARIKAATSKKAAIEE